MYRETLVEQKKLFEERQKACERLDLSDAIELSHQIIRLAKLVDEYDEEKLQNEIQYKCRGI